MTAVEQILFPRTLPHIRMSADSGMSGRADRLGLALSPASEV
jgi:hypothetical protein